MRQCRWFPSRPFVELRRGGAPGIALLVLMVLLAGPSRAAALRVGTEADNPPFSELGSGGAPEGFNVDVGNEICRRLGTVCAWSEMKFDGLLPSVENGSIDAALAEITVTPARSARVEFTQPVTETGGMLVVGATSEITDDPASMKGQVIGVQAGTTHELYAAQHFAGAARVEAYATQQQAFADLIAGRLNAVLCDVKVAYAWLEGHSGTFRFADHAIVAPPVYGANTAIAVRQGNDALRARIDFALKAMMRDGTFATITRRYFAFSVAPGSFGDPL